MKKTNEGIDTSSDKKISRRALMQGAAVLAGGTAVSVLSPASLAVAQVRTVTAPSAAPSVVTASVKKNIVETDSGKVYGSSRNGIVIFKGIPYGASTEGKNRFMPPSKPASWSGVRSALYWGPVCPQYYTNTVEGRRAGWKIDDYAFLFQWDDGQPGEDCLRLNVFTPAINDNKKRPVMFWIHGGGYTSGSGQQLPMCDGESLVHRGAGDVVVVSVNHRLAVLGFLNLMDYGQQYASSPNVSMLDLVAALQWVKTNISNFGGDPNNVLIFGQSGGGAKVGTLMGMPSAKGLFHRAVIESGSSLRQATPEASAKLTAAVLTELGLTKGTLSKIHELPDETIVRAGLRAEQKITSAAGAGPGAGYGPVVDGKILPRHAWDPTGPSYSADVPLMVGTVLNEQTNSVFMGDPNLEAMNMAEAKRRLSATRSDADHLIAVFQELYPKATPFELLSRITAMSGRVNAVLQAERKAAQGAAPAFLYWFQWQTQILDGRARAFHCSELPFVFHSTDLVTTITGGTAEARNLAGRVSDAWINFARKGNPNHPGLPVWPKYDAAKVPTMIFDTKCAMQNDPDGSARKAVAAGLRASLGTNVFEEWA